MEDSFCREKKTYEFTHDELVWGARMAWRNAPRCPARVIWKNLTVFDKRHIDTADEMFKAICDHLEYSNNGGNIRPAITVFRQRIAGKPDPRVWNNLMCQYAGYKMEDGSVVGDPGAVGITEVTRSYKQCASFNASPLSFARSSVGRGKELRLIFSPCCSLGWTGSPNTTSFLSICA